MLTRVFNPCEQMKSFRKGKLRSPWLISANSILVFMLREMKSRYVTTRLGLLWAILDPAAILVMLILLRAVIRGRESPMVGASPVEFFFWGVLAFFMFSQPATSTTKAIKSARGLLAYRQITIIDVVVARVLLEWMMLLLVGLLALAFWWLFGNSVAIADPLGVLVYTIALLFLALAYGLLAEVVSELVPDARRIFAMLMRPMLFISGLFFTMDMIPFGAEKYLVWNPVLHLVDLTRGAALGSYHSPGSLSYAIGFASVLGLVGLAAYRRYRDFLQQ